MVMLTSVPGSPRKYFHRVRQRQVLRALAVNLDDAVAGQDARLETRRVFHRRDDRDEIVLHRDHDAQPAELALGVVLQLLVFVRAP